MATYVLKRKLYSDDNKYKDHTVRNTLGVAAGTALAFAGARRGMFGKQAALTTNKWWANMGKTFGSNKMMVSGGQGVGKYQGKIEFGSMTKDAQKALGPNALKNMQTNITNNYLTNEMGMQQNSKLKLGWEKTPQLPTTNTTTTNTTTKKRNTKTNAADNNATNTAATNTATTNTTTRKRNTKTNTTGNITTDITPTSAAPKQGGYGYL